MQNLFSYSPPWRPLWTEMRRLFSLGLPLIASQLIYSSSGFLATIMVAHLGEQTLAASVLVSMTWATLSVLFFGMLNTISVFVAHRFGAKDESGISDVMGQAFILGLIITLLITLVLQIMPYFLRWSSQPAPVLALATQYMSALKWTVPGLVTCVVCEQFLAGLGHSKTVMLVSMMVVPLEITMIYLLVFGKCGLPALGIAGIGYGFAISFTLTSIGFVTFLCKSKHYRPYKMFAAIARKNIALLKDMIRTGLPIGFMSVIEVSTFAAATFIIAQFGTTILAAHQLVLQFSSLAITVVFAISQAVTIQVGHAVGARDLTKIRLTTYSGMLLNFFGMAVVDILFIFYPHLLLSLDLSSQQGAHQQLLTDASHLLAINALGLLLDNFRIIGFGALRGLKDTQFPMYTSLISFWGVGLTCAYVFSTILHGEGAGVWWGLVSGIALGLGIVLLRLRFILKRVDFNRILQLKAE